MKKNTVKIVLSTVLVGLVIAFIFSNSVQGSEESNLQSSFVMHLLRRILDPSHSVDETIFHYYVRKGAHFSEFFLLGTSLWMQMKSIQRKTSRFFPGILFFSALAVAVLDEYIQSFTGRTSSVADVLIDFSGSVTAFALLWLLFLIVRASPKKQKEDTRYELNQ